MGDDHAWARFGVGSWKLVRVVTQALDETGNVESTTTEETRTTLVQVDSDRYTVKVEVTVEVAGKRFNAEPKYVTRGFNGEQNGQQVAVQDLGTGEVSICGRRYPIRIRQIVINGTDTRLTSKVLYSAEVAPHVLRRETTGTDITGKVNSFESLVEVLAVDMPHKVLSEIKPSSHVKTVHKQAGGDTTITLEVHCADVPGAVVAHTEKTLDPNGRVLQQRTLELLDYEALTKEIQHRVNRRGLFSRRRRGFSPPN